jgi:HPt (histidine-containing phosphotransfer) domain-containing protein
MDHTIIDKAALDRLEEWGGADLARQMVRLFLESAPERIDQIRTCEEDEPGDLPERGGHSLKSSAANVGAQEVRRLAERIEDHAANGDLEAVRTLLPEIEAAFDRARDVLESLTMGIAE